MCRLLIVKYPALTPQRRNGFKTPETQQDISIMQKPLRIKSLSFAIAFFPPHVFDDETDRIFDIFTKWFIDEPGFTGLNLFFQRSVTRKICCRRKMCWTRTYFSRSFLAFIMVCPYLDIKSIRNSSGWSSTSLYIGW